MTVERFDNIGAGSKLYYTLIKGPKFVKFEFLKQKISYLEGHLAPSSHCSILIEIPLASEASSENDLSKAPIATMDANALENLTNSDITHYKPRHLRRGEINLRVRP